MAKKKNMYNIKVKVMKVKILSIALLLILISCSTIKENSLESKVKNDPNNVKLTYDLMKYYERNGTFADYRIALFRYLIIEESAYEAKIELDKLYNLLFVNNSSKSSYTICLNPETLKSKSSINLYLEMTFGTQKIRLTKNKDSSSFINKNITFFKNYFVEIKRLYTNAKQDDAKQVDLDENFTFRFYSPYFIEILDRDFVDAFVNTIYFSYNLEEVQIWCKANQEKLSEFLRWSQEYNWKKK